MFSMKQKQQIAAEVEKVILSFNHPEMPTEKPKFHLRIDGKESWSWAEIAPNWTFENHEPGINQYNEIVADQMEKRDSE